MNPPEAPPRRWMVIALQVVVPVATFAAGWYVAVRAADNPAPQIKTVASHKSVPGPLSADDLAKAKADLAKILKISGSVRRDHALLDFIADLDAGSVKVLLTDLETKPLSSLSADENTEAMDLLGRWAELDPKATLDWAQSLNDPQKKNMSLAQVFETWSAQDPAAALAALRNLPAGLQSGTRSFYSFSGDQSGALYSEIFGSWADSDPIGASAAALNLPSSSMRNQSLKSVANTWAQQDPAGALAWANTLPVGYTREDAVNAAVEGMSIQNPQAAADYASKLPGDKNRDALLQNIAQNWTLQDPLAALAWADNTLTGAAHDDAVHTAFEYTSFTDPATAAAYLASNPNVVNTNNNDDVFMLAFSWAGQDSKAALNWAQSLPETNANVRNEALSEVLTEWSDSDPVAAAAYIQNLTDDPNFSKLTAGVARIWGNADPQAALAWAKGLPAGDAQNTTLVNTIGSIAAFDPQTAMIEAQQLSGDNRDKATVSVISALAMQQPADAATALQNLPAGKNLDGATANVASAWLRQDPAAASQWIDTLPQGSARDGAVAQLVSAVGQNDPASAFNWAVSIGNVSTRNTQVVKLATQWAAKDPASAAGAAQNALTLTNLSAAQRTSLQKIANGTPNP